MHCITRFGHKFELRKSIITRESSFSCNSWNSSSQKKSLQLSTICHLRQHHFSHLNRYRSGCRMVYFGIHYNDQKHGTRSHAFTIIHFIKFTRAELNPDHLSGLRPRIEIFKSDLSCRLLHLLPLSCCYPHFPCRLHYNGSSIVKYKAFEIY